MATLRLSGQPYKRDVFAADKGEGRQPPAAELKNGN